MEVSWERLELPDGDFLDLAWGPGEGPLVLVLSGLEGSIRSPYARGILKALAEGGMQGVLMHFRGTSGEPNRLPRSYHSGETGDLAFVAGTLKKRFPQRPLGAVGYSLGGNVLLKWLGEGGGPLSAACAVSVPFRLEAAAERLEQGFSRLYQWGLLRGLRRSMERKFRRIPPPFPLDLGALKTFRAFDEAITAPLHGFGGADDYYRRASCLPYLKNIRTPTLILHARDDPFLPPAAIPKEGELSPWVTLELARSGGHVGFVEGRLLPRYFLERRIPSFLQERLNHTTEEISHVRDQVPAA